MDIPHSIQTELTQIFIATLLGPEVEFGAISQISIATLLLELTQIFLATLLGLELKFGAISQIFIATLLMELT